MLALAGFAGLSGCETSDESVDTTDVTPKPQPGTNNPPEEDGPCTDDRDCPGYLRCYDASCIEPPAVTGEAREDTPTVVLTQGGEEVARLQVELALEEWERMRGLMFRKKMAEGWGMLFDFGSDGPRSFWMRNTLIPLDMIFINSSGVVVGIVRRAEPLTETPRSVDEPSRYVLEIPGGQASALGINAGARMSIENGPASIKPNSD